MDFQIAKLARNAVSIRSLVISTILFASLLFTLEQHPAGASLVIPTKGIDLASGHNVAEGVWSDGVTMWVVANSQRKLLAYNLQNRNRRPGKDIKLASYNSKPQGIWSDGTVIWVADWDDTKLYGYLLSNGVRREGRDIDLTGRNDGPRGVLGNGSLIYVVDKDDTYVYAYNKSDGQRQYSEEFNLNGENDHPWGIWGDASTVWISDIEDEMLYAYKTSTSSLSDAVRHQKLEHRIPPYGDEPRGIWSDGETMWVVEESTTGLYAMFLRNFRRKSDDIAVPQVSTPRGLWTDGETMWVVEAGATGSQKLFAYNADTGQREGRNDIRLDSSSTNPVGIWSDGEIIWVADDGAGNDFLSAHALDQELTDTQLLVSYKSIVLHSDNSAPAGVWSDGDTIWVADSDDLKVYAYDLEDRTRKADDDFDLHQTNADPRAIWSDGEILWVLDFEKRYVFAYPFGSWDLALLPREFWLNPANSNPTGLTGYGKRVWVTDEEDSKLFSYTKLNSPATFRQSSAKFNIHYTLNGDTYVGTVPEVIDLEGDTLSYFLRGHDSGQFTIDQSGNIRTAAGATDFTGGDNYSLNASVSDGKEGLDSSDDGIDDSINISIHVYRNADPVFDTPDGTIFNVAEDVTDTDIIAQIDVSDLDEGSLEEIVSGDQTLPFAFDDGEIKLLTGQSLDYELQDSYGVKLTIFDLKDKDGEYDASVDDEIQITVNVTNVDEDGEVTLNSSQPEVGKAIAATVTDPDGVDLSGGKKINWVLSRNSVLNSTGWTEISNTETTSSTFEYTAVAADAGIYLRFKAIYRDEQDSSAERTQFANTNNTVLAQPPTNGPPTFSEGSLATRTIPEDAANLDNVGEPVSATDPDGDTLTFDLDVTARSLFQISDTGQIQVKNNSSLDYENKSRFRFRVWVDDYKDADGNQDPAADAVILVTVQLTNVDEPGVVTLLSESPQVGVEIRAGLYDPDRNVANSVLQWQTAETIDSETWSDINGASNYKYTPVPSDVGKYLRLNVSYDDFLGPDKQASATASNPVYRAANGLPSFDAGGDATRQVPENAPPGTRVGAAVTATDPEGDALTYSLASGSDSGNFTLEPSTGRMEVSSDAILDYEANPTLIVELQVSDGNDANHEPDSSIDDNIEVVVNLVDLDEPGRVSLSAMEPRVDTAVVATLTDLDGSIRSTHWQWEKSVDGLSGWTAIDDNSEDTYTPTADDMDKYLRAMAEYTDGHGAGKSALGMTDDSVGEAVVVDTSLQSLTLTETSLPFHRDTLLYSHSVPNDVESTTVTATPSAPSDVQVEIIPSDPDSGTNGHQVAFDRGIQ